jgi:RHS repeat-associated protein
MPVTDTTNRLASSTGYAYDAAGNVTGGDSYNFTDDALGQTASKTYTASGNVVFSETYIYSVGDERIGVQASVSDNSSGNWWNWSVRDERGKVLREFTSLEMAAPFGLTSHNWSRDYVWRDGLLLASVFPTTPGSPGTTTYHYHMDHLGTPRLVTADGGVIVGKHTYYPFGAEMDLTPKEASFELMKFTGHERDIVAGDNHSVDYMHARLHNPNLGRFLSVDPALGDPRRPQSWNRYAYVRNNPIKNVDPDGRDVWVASDMQAAVTYGNRFSPSFRSQYVQLRDDHRVYWLIQGEHRAKAGTRAHSTTLELKTDETGAILHAGELSFIPRFLDEAMQAQLIGHEGNHLAEEISTGHSIQDRFKNHDKGVILNPAAGPNAYESSQVLVFERVVSQELRSGTEMLPEPKPLIRDAAELTPGGH